MVPEEGVKAPRTMARYSRWISLRCPISDRMDAAKECLATTVRPDVSRSRRLQQRKQRVCPAGKIPGQSICQRIVPIVKRGMYGHTGWLVDHKQILVLEEDIQRKRYRTDIFGGFILLDSKNQQVSCLHRTVEKNTLSVYQNAVRHPLQARQIAGGKAFVPEKLAYANGLVWCCDRILDGAVHSNTGLLCVDIGKAAAKFFKHVNEKPPDSRNPVVFISRSDRIRTCGLCVPNAALYQTEPRLSRQFFTINRFNRDCKSYYIDFGGICQDINFFFLKFCRNMVWVVCTQNGRRISG